MPAKADASVRWKTLFATVLVVLPAITFYLILFHFAVNIPIMDDYDASLGYLNHLTQIPTFGGRLLLCLTAQHNEYKVLFANAVMWLQYAVFRHVDFRITCAAGNFFILPIACLLWKMFLPAHKDLAARLALFAPVTMLLFQLSYFGTLDWTLSGLVHMPCLAFSIAAIYLLQQETRPAYYFALLALALSIGASTNGFFVVPIGLLLLNRQRNYIRIASWLAVTAACLALYLYHYTVLPSRGRDPHSLVSAYLLRRPLFLLGFLGNAVFIPKPACVVFGVAVVAGLIFMVRRGYWQKNPLVASCILFLFITALAVANLRSRNGILGGSDSRYRIYGDLLIVFCWSFFVEEFLIHHPLALRRNRPFKAVLIVSSIFCVLMDGSGAYSLMKRHNNLIRGMALYEHPEPGQPPGPVLPMPDQPPEYDRFDAHARSILDKSVALGIYSPPMY